MIRETCETRRIISMRRLGFALAVVVLSVLTMATSAQAQTIGGHIGFVLPLVTNTDGHTTNLADNFNIGFPVGITVKGKGRGAFDMEFVPSIQDSPRKVSLTLHPGGVWSIGHGFAVGMRAAFDVNSSQFGFTPLLNKSWPIHSENGFFKAYFVEAVLPVRFNRPVGAPANNAVTFGMHFGLGF